MKYRDYYKKFFNIEFDDRFEIHHINFDRKDNDISNLILLPKEVHRAVHDLMYNLSYGDNSFGLILSLGIINEHTLYNLKYVWLWYDLKEQAMMEIQHAISEGREYVNFYQYEINKFYNNIK